MTGDDSTDLDVVPADLIVHVDLILLLQTGYIGTDITLSTCGRQRNKDGISVSSDIRFISLCTESLRAQDISRLFPTPLPVKFKSRTG